jgi:hypothetical protein
MSRIEIPNVCDRQLKVDRNSNKIGRATHTNIYHTCLVRGARGPRTTGRCILGTERRRSAVVGMTATSKTKHAPQHRRFHIHHRHKLRAASLRLYARMCSPACLSRHMETTMAGGRFRATKHKYRQRNRLRGSCVHPLVSWTAQRIRRAAFEAKEEDLV